LIWPSLYLKLHGVGADGAVILQNALLRGAVLSFPGKLKPCLVGMEAKTRFPRLASSLSARRERFIAFVLRNTPYYQFHPNAAAYLGNTPKILQERDCCVSAL